MAEKIVESISDFGLSKEKKSTTLFSKVGIVYCGNDGQYIARVCSSYGMDVTFWETNEERIKYSIDSIEAIMDSRIRNWGATESEKKAVMSRIKGTTSLNDLKKCDLVIETAGNTGISRTIDARKKIFEVLEKIVDSKCIIASNTATVTISDLTEDLACRDRCISIHFMINSVDARIVEITRGLYTSNEAYEKVTQFIHMVKRKPIPVEESLGLISVRLLTVMVNEACEMVQEGVGSKEDIEQLMHIGWGMRMGPFSVADIMGIDRMARWMEKLFNEFGDPKFKPNPLIKKLIRQRHFGVSSGQGFFSYDENGERIK